MVTALEALLESSQLKNQRICKLVQLERKKNGQKI